MAGILDPDTHIAEPLEMREHFDVEWHPRRPVIVEVPDDTWVPFALHQLSGTMQADADWWGPKLFDPYRLGGDPCAQIGTVSTLRSREEHSGQTIDKLLIDNPRALHGAP